jgi:aryl-alcohol dehydrogenase-like predicted oxidoreductase
MKYRKLGKTGMSISEVSLGTWQVGGGWGQPFNEKTAEEIINKSIDLGINFIDTADVYNSGMSEKIIGKVLKSRSETIYVATKCGRRLNPHAASGYNEKNIRGFIEDSLRNMNLEAIDLIQLHCPPTEVFYKDEAFETLERLKQEGKILHYGVSVEKVEEALKAIEYPGVETVQIIFNMFRQKPSDIFFKEAQKSDTGVIVRVPLASGLLTGKMSRNTEFSTSDHRFFNRNGESFDKGETFSGVNYEIGLEAVEELKKIFTDDENLPLYAMKWILMHDAVSCVIPGASKLEQALNNVKASDFRPLTEEERSKVKAVYEKYIKPEVHLNW